MDYNVQVCDWTQVRKDNQYKYGVSVNSSVVYKSNKLDECLEVKRLIIKGFNVGVSAAHSASQRAINSIEIKGSVMFDEDKIFVVTPEMQRKAKGN